MNSTINIARTNEECLKNVIKYARLNEYITDIKNTLKYLKKLPIDEIRYMDNGYRIFEARKNWKKLSEKIL